MLSRDTTEEAIILLIFGLVRCSEMLQVREMIDEFGVSCECSQEIYEMSGWC
jgi:hypothetical protein